MPHKDITQRRAYQKQYRARCRLSRADQRHCVVGDCRRTDSLRRGMCDLHYKRWWKHGDPLYEQPRLTIAERLVKYSDRSGGEDSCWLWTGGTITGYGVIKITHRNVFAHRASWELAHGPIPDGLFVLHNCPGGDNRACINPRHLFLGTDQDNYHDRVRKGGAPLKPTPSHGESNGSAKLTPQDVREMRELYAGGATLVSLGAVYGVSDQSARAVVRKETWKHVE